MGTLQAREFAASVENESISLELALTWHFRSNHYPPLPLSLIPVAIKIINGEVEDSVELPDGITWRGQTSAPVWACVQAWHLGEFLEE